MQAYTYSRSGQWKRFEPEIAVHASPAFAKFSVGFAMVMRKARGIICGPAYVNL
jgi:hypothetical protein